AHLLRAAPGHRGARLRRVRRAGHGFLAPAHRHRARVLGALAPRRPWPLAPHAARAMAAAPMKAAVHVGSSRLELREWPEPRVGAGELLVRLRGCGLCGSDLVKLAREAPTPAVL